MLASRSERNFDRGAGRIGEQCIYPSYLNNLELTFQQPTELDLIEVIFSSSCLNASRMFSFPARRQLRSYKNKEENSQHKKAPDYSRAQHLASKVYWIGYRQVNNKDSEWTNWTATDNSEKHPVSCSV